MTTLMHSAFSFKKVLFSGPIKGEYVIKGFLFFVVFSKAVFASHGGAPFASKVIVDKQKKQGLSQGVSSASLEHLAEDSTDSLFGGKVSRDDASSGTPDYSQRSSSSPFYQHSDTQSPGLEQEDEYKKEYLLLSVAPIMLPERFNDNSNVNDGIMSDFMSDTKFELNIRFLEFMCSKFFNNYSGLKERLTYCKKIDLCKNFLNEKWAAVFKNYENLTFCKKIEARKLFLKSMCSEFLRVDSDFNKESKSAQEVQERKLFLNSTWSDFFSGYSESNKILTFDEKLALNEQFLSLMFSGDDGDVAKLSALFDCHPKHAIAVDYFKAWSKKLHSAQDRELINKVLTRDYLLDSNSYPNPPTRADYQDASDYRIGSRRQQDELFTALIAQHSRSNRS